MKSMQLTGNIARLEFNKDGVTIYGRTWSQCNRNRCDSSTNFSQSWFWFDSTFPKEVSKLLEKLVQETNGVLQERGVIPKHWPTALTDEPQEDMTTPFQFCIGKISIANSIWGIDKEPSTVEINVTSRFYEDKTERVPIEFKKELIGEVFTTLVEHL
jgi:hypothetical protein